MAYSGTFLLYFEAELRLNINSLPVTKRTTLRQHKDQTASSEVTFYTENKTKCFRREMNPPLRETDPATNTVHKAR